MIDVRFTTRHRIRCLAIEELCERLEQGSKHSCPRVQKAFCDARHLAAKALCENSENALVVAALIYLPCEMLANENYSFMEWTSESIRENGTLDWLEIHFGVEIAETIRLVPHSRRFLASVIPAYFEGLDAKLQIAVLKDGGLMPLEHRIIFSSNRYQRNALRLSSWIDQENDPLLDLPGMEFFLPFVETAMRHG